MRGPTRSTTRMVVIGVAAAVSLLALAVSVAGCSRTPAVGPSWKPTPKTLGSLHAIASTKGEQLLLHTADADRVFVAGVNLGPTIPGTSPGELAQTAEDYRRWFPMMSELGFRAIRVYTIMPPAFYQELRTYNLAHADSPLYLVHGVWIPEERFYATKNLWDKQVVTDMKAEVDDAVAAVHGTLTRDERRGSAWGTWTADVSPWVYAWSLGVEWDPLVTSVSDKTNKGHASYAGRYFASKPDASPTEIWIATMLDHLAADEATLGVTMPLTFTNWPTTDPLRHPDEPLGREDIVGVDANHITVTTAWRGGFFASYHAYPYYPDFQRHEKALLATKHDGKADPYAGYLAALRKHHAGMPLVITEFGVPSATGSAHSGPLGRDQGAHSEQGALAIDADLLSIIRERGCAGGFLFEWADEWFKFTWNTIDYELPADRRQMWVDPWTNEEHFGILAMDAGATRTVTLDGRDTEWSTNGSQVIYEGRGAVREVRALADEAALSLRIVLDKADSWKATPLAVGFDTLPGGNRGLPEARDSTGSGSPWSAGTIAPDADNALVIGPKDATLLVRASNDPYALVYGAQKHFIPFNAASAREGSGVWNPWTLVTNRPLTIPSTGDKLPIETFDASTLLPGTNDPAAPTFDSRAAWAAAGTIVEVRLPWLGVGVSDPSSLRALKVANSGAISPAPFERIGITAAMAGQAFETNGYAWEPWQKVTWTERVKAGAAKYTDAIRAVEAN